MERIEAWLDGPSVASSLKIVLGLLTALFSSEGLTGLFVLVIAQLGLIYVLATRKMRRFEKEAQRLAQFAIESLETRLDRVVHRVRTERQESLELIQDGINRLTELSSEFAAGNQPRVSGIQDQP